VYEKRREFGGTMVSAVVRFGTTRVMAGNNFLDDRVYDDRRLGNRSGDYADEILPYKIRLNYQHS